MDWRGSATERCCRERGGVFSPPLARAPPRRKMLCGLRWASNLHFCVSNQAEYGFFTPGVAPRALASLLFFFRRAFRPTNRPGSPTCYAKLGQISRCGHVWRSQRFANCTLATPADFATSAKSTTWLPSLTHSSSFLASANFRCYGAP